MEKSLIKKIALLYNESIPDFAPKTSRITYWSEFFNSENARLLSDFDNNGQISPEDCGRLALNVLEYAHLLTMHTVFAEHLETLVAMTEEFRKLSEIISLTKDI